MRLTVLGKSPSWQDAGGACSGYLLQEDGATVLIDCGNGVFSKLRQFVDYVDVDAVVVSHLHADHFLDLVPYSYALTYAPRQQPVRAAPGQPVPAAPGPDDDQPASPRLIGPPGTRQTLRRVVGAWGNEDLIENAFRLEEYEEDSTPEVGPLRFRFASVPHFTQTFAMRIESARGGGSLAYSADSSPSKDLIELVAGCELLLIEATLPRPEEAGPRGHLTAEEAGEHAKAANAGRVVLTHISDELDAARAREQASAAFGGRVEVAGEGAVYEI